MSARWSRSCSPIWWTRPGWPSASTPSGRARYSGRFYDVTTDELEALRGRPEKFIGDAVMAVFGLPQVHEDDALRAVRAGLAIRAKVGRLCDELGLAEPLQIRVGIETGEAAAGTGPEGQLLVPGRWSTAPRASRARPRPARCWSARRRARSPTRRCGSATSGGSMPRGSPSSSRRSPSSG